MKRVISTKIKMGSLIWLFLLMSFLAGCSTCEEPNSCTGNSSRWGNWGEWGCSYDNVECCGQYSSKGHPYYDSNPCPPHDCNSQHQAYVADLAKAGVQLIEVGDNVTFVLPADNFFMNQTPVLDEHYFYTLNQIAFYICCVEKINVKVAGYTDCAGSSIRNLALSRAQAQAIANYLWQRGIDARVMYVVGYGAQAPIANNCTCQGQAMNRRVEISFLRITDNYDY